MKLFSLLILGVISLCSMGYAQNPQNRPENHREKAERFLSVEYIPVQQTFTYMDKCIPWGTITSNPTGDFSLSKDGLTIKVAHRGSYKGYLEVYPYADYVTPYDTIRMLVQFSEDGKTWQTQLDYFTILNIPAKVYFSIWARKSGYLRLMNGGASTKAPVYFKPNTRAVQFTMQNIAPW